MKNATLADGRFYIVGIKFHCWVRISLFFAQFIPSHEYISIKRIGKPNWLTTNIVILLKVYFHVGLEDIHDYLLNLKYTNGT
jgi:hypothetical protein